MESRLGHNIPQLTPWGRVLVEGREIEDQDAAKIYGLLDTSIYITQT